MSKHILGILCSGRGSNMQSILAAIDRGQIKAEVGIVLTDKPQARALEYAKSVGIKSVCVNRKECQTQQEFEEKLRGLPMSNPNARNFARKFRANAVKCEIDKQGRLTVPQPLRDFAKIDKELTTIGNGDKIEVWSRDIWESDEGAGMLENIDIAEGMEQYGI